MASPARLEVAFGDSAEPAAPKPASPPFLVAPPNSEITNEGIRNLFGEIIRKRDKDHYSITGAIIGKNEPQGEWLPKEANPFGAKPILLISAQAHFISGGSVAGNVGKGAVNTLLAIGMVVGGKGGGDFMEIDKDNLAITLRLFEPVSGALVWEDKVNASENADEAVFAR